MGEPVGMEHRGPSAFRAFRFLVVQSFQRHWRVRQLGWVAVGLLGLSVAWVAAVTASPAGWRLEDRHVRRLPVTYREYGQQLLAANRYAALEHPITDRPVAAVETPHPFAPLRDSLAGLVLAIPHTVLSSETFLNNWAVMNFSRWVVLGVFLGFVLPMFTLAYASGAIGTDRESRAMIWLMTRPMPRSAIYLAKLAGALPWCLVFGVGGFAVLCLAGGSEGREALRLYWPAAAAGTVAFAALFHLFGAVFRRPVVVGLVYVFFLEFLVAGLPGSLKLLSLTFYVRCLMYNGANAAGYPVDMLDVPQPVSDTTAWAVLAAATLGLTALGMVLFARLEYRDDI